MHTSLPVIIIISLSGLALAGIIPGGGVFNPLSSAEFKADEQSRGMHSITLINNENSYGHHSGHGAASDTDCEEGKKAHRPKLCPCATGNDDSVSSSENEEECECEEEEQVTTSGGKCVCDQSESSDESAEQCNCAHSATTTTVAEPTTTAGTTTIAISTTATTSAYATYT